MAVSFAMERGLHAFLRASPGRSACSSLPCKQQFRQISRFEASSWSRSRRRWSAGRFDCFEFSKRSAQGQGIRRAEGHTASSCDERLAKPWQSPVAKPCPRSKINNAPRMVTSPGQSVLLETLLPNARQCLPKKSLAKNRSRKKTPSKRRRRIHRTAPGVQGAYQPAKQKRGRPLKSVSRINSAILLSQLVACCLHNANYAKYAARKIREIGTAVLDMLSICPRRFDFSDW